MSIRTTAVKQPDGGYIVNGTKKWITNGNFADYFTTFVKTDEGFAVLCIPRGEGVETRQLKTAYSSNAGTAFVTFDNVYVPPKNLIGQDGMGIMVVLSNFNHERWVMCCGTIRGARLALEEALLWTNQRKAFGRPLTSQAVIRQKLGKLMADVESAQAWLEALTFQMNQLSYKEQSKYLAGHIALLKAWATRVSTEVAETVVNLFGGRGLTKTGMGRGAVAFYHGVKFDAILGGTEEILTDLGVRQSLRFMPKHYKL